MYIIRFIIALILILSGLFNEVSGMLSYVEAKSAIHQILGTCFLILGTLQFILAYLVWPKEKTTTSQSIQRVEPVVEMPQPTKTKPLYSFQQTR